MISWSLSPGNLKRGKTIESNTIWGREICLQKITQDDCYFRFVINRDKEEKNRSNGGA